MKRYRIYLIIMLMVLSPIVLCADGRNERVKWGVEWGAQMPAFNSLKCAYLAEDGYLVEYSKRKFRTHTNGSLSAFIGYDIRRNVNLSLYGGYTGLDMNARGVGVSVRASGYFKEHSLGSYSKLFGEAGISIERKKPLSHFYRIGYGYRLRLSDLVSLDLNCGIQTSFTHPKFYDSVSRKYLYYNEMEYLRNLCVGVFATVAFVF